MKWIRKIIHDISYSFPVQLFFLHLKKQNLFSVLWVILFLTIGNSFGTKYGIPLLLLDPEYRHQVNFLSFFIIGLSMGGFIMAWNVCCYILNSYRFDFLACVSKPFVRFAYNNILIPGVFTVMYIIIIYIFQTTNGNQTNKEILSNILGLIIGNIVIIIIYTVYFIYFTDDIKRFLERISEKTKEKLKSQNINIENILDITKGTNIKRGKWHVDNYWHYPWKIKITNELPIYDKKLIEAVFFLHHRNIIVIILISISILISLGFLIENPIFRIPAGATLFLMFIVLMIFATLFTFWFRGWRTPAIVVVIIILNILTQYDLIVYNHKLAGLNYNNKREYSNNAIKQYTNRTQLLKDIQYTEQILSRWKKKNAVEKPKLIIINVGGGGSKASYWTFTVLQELNKLTNGTFLNRTMLMSGASGGMFGAAYYRELFLRKKLYNNIEIDNKTYLDDIGKDLLNGVTSSITSNDMFYPFRKFQYQGQTYNKDRGYFFDKIFNENTHYLLDKKLNEYKNYEKQAIIPMMIIASTIINDQRMLYFSPQPISYLLRPYINSNQSINDYIGTDALEFRTFFKEQGSEQVNLVNILRTNATYPYIFPSVSLPTVPETKAMDAGLRDNFGLIVTSRFLSSFKTWIEENTGGVIVVTIKVDDKTKEQKKEDKKSYISELLSPVGGFIANLINLQYFNSDQAFATIYNNYSTNLNFIDFTYHPSKKNRAASLSLHLNEREKIDIQNSFYNKENTLAKDKLLQLIY